MTVTKGDFEDESGKDDSVKGKGKAEQHAPEGDSTLQGATGIWTDPETGDLDEATKRFLDKLKELLCCDAEIELYGCNTGAGEYGEKYIQSIANATGATATGYAGSVNNSGYTLTESVTRSPETK